MKKAELSTKTETKKLLEKESFQKPCLETVKGVIAAFSVVILYTTSATCVQLLERRILDFELNAFRSGIPLIFYSIGLIIMWEMPVIEKSEIGVILLYSLGGSSSKMGEFVAVTFLPAATTSCVFSTSSVILGLPLFALLLKESVTVKKLLFAGMCICGVILVVQPWIAQRTPRVDFEDSRNHSLHASVHYNNAEDFELGADFDYQDVSGLSTTPVTNTVNFTKTFTGTAFVSEIIGYTTSVAGGILLASEVIFVKRYPYIHEHILESTFWGGALVLLCL